MPRHEGFERFGDAHLDALFSTLNRELTDAEFTTNVMRRVRDAQLRRAGRAAVIAAAAAIGVAVALGPVVDLIAGALDPAADLWSALRSTDASAALGWLDMYRLPAFVVALCLAAWPALARWIAR
jgi:H+/Cl- antiporter ClcA